MPIFAASLGGATSRQPADPIAAKALQVLERSCAACHQATTPAESGRVRVFGNILDLDAIRLAADLVRPGEPDASRLYTIMLTGHASVDLGAGAGAPLFAPVQADDVDAIRTWIETLEPSRGCDDRTPVTAAAVADLARRWLAQRGSEVARDTRFISLAHLHNICTPLADLAGFRHGVEKLLNSLSRAAHAIAVDTIGDASLLLAFRLSDLGWSGEHWETLAAARRTIPRRSSLAPPDVVAATGTSSPILLADWFAHAATDGALYARLLDLPKELRSIRVSDGLDLEAAAMAGKASRVAMASSAESAAPRIIERHPADAGPMWLASDLAETARPEALVTHPLLPYQAEGSGAPDVAQTQIISRLPNGYLAFSVYDDAAQLAWREAGGGEPGNRSRSPTSAGPRACFACHGRGLLGVKEVLKPPSNGKPGPRGAADTGPAPADYATLGEVNERIAADNAPYRHLQVDKGVDPDITVRGVDPVAALAREYERDVALTKLSSELAIEAGELVAMLEQHEGTGLELARRLLHGPLARNEADRLAVALGLSVSAGGFDGTATSTGARDRLAVWTEKRVYAVGEPVTISATATADCYVTIISIDSAMRATVIYPNAFEQGNLLHRGTTLVVPGPEAPYRFRLSEPGSESFVGICRQDTAVPRGMTHDFERQMFTALGNWPAFLTRMLGEPSAARPAAASRRSVRRRGRVQRDPPAPPPLGSGIEMRAAARVRVE